MWRPVLDRVCELKEALDHALRWRQPDNDHWIAKSLEREGVDLTLVREAASDASYGADVPSHFVVLLTGKWFSQEEAPEDVGWLQVPAWSVIGWVRKEEDRLTPMSSQSEIEIQAAQLDALVVADELVHNGPPRTWGIQGLPLFCASEGKNRAQLYRLADLPRTCPVMLLPCPDLARYCVRRVRLRPDVAVLQYPDVAVDLLPFGDLSISLLTAMGVPFERIRSMRGLVRLYSILAEQVGAFGALRILLGARSKLVVRMLRQS